MCRVEGLGHMFRATVALLLARGINIFLGSLCFGVLGSRE